jgi:hypothetical protein
MLWRIHETIPVQHLAQSLMHTKHTRNIYCFYYWYVFLMIITFALVSTQMCPVTHCRTFKTAARQLYRWLRYRWQNDRESSQLLCRWRGLKTAIEQLKKWGQRFLEAWVSLVFFCILGQENTWYNFPGLLFPWKEKKIHYTFLIIKMDQILIVIKIRMQLPVCYSFFPFPIFFPCVHTSISSTLTDCTFTFIQVRSLQN